MVAISIALVIGVAVYFLFRGRDLFALYARADRIDRSPPPDYPKWLRKARREEALHEAEEAQRQANQAARHQSQAVASSDRSSRRLAIRLAVLSALVGFAGSYVIALLVHPIK